MSEIRFSATKYTNLKKVGKYEPDADGYYTVVIGGLNVLNSSGELYLAERAKTLFESSSLFMRRVNNGNLKGENGHPKKLPGMTEDQYVDRALEVQEANVCVHYKEIWLDPEFGRKNPHLNAPTMIGILAKVRPTGAMGHVLQQALDNPHENLCFSIRCFTEVVHLAGQRCKHIDEIITFDLVTEPGIAAANKWDSPTFESVKDVIVGKKTFEKILAEEGSAVSMESSKVIARTMLQKLTPTPAVKTGSLGFKGW